jgi:hypothetical protein
MPATLDFSDVLALSSRTHRPCSSRMLEAVRSAASVRGESLVDGIADPSLEGAHRVFASLALGLFAQVVGASGCVVTHLGDRGHVDRMVELAVTARVEAVPFLRSG